MYKMKNKLNGNNSILDIAEETISELHDITMKIIQNETQQEKKAEKELTKYQ